jgi:hypothetical protein
MHTNVLEELTASIWELIVEAVCSFETLRMQYIPPCRVVAEFSYY